jgi:anaphase-promoting complex subunit 1
MAAVQSLGLHTPSALPHLIAESILPPEPSPDQYSWETYVNGDVEEEVLFTPSCVAWSQGRLVQKLFSFDIEQEKVQHALLTWFPAHESQDDVSKSSSPDAVPASQSRHQTKAVPGSSSSAQQPKSVLVPARALVVLLQYQAHIFFLSGASHLVKLPFEVERVFPAPRGIILQRRLALVPSTSSQSTIGRPGPPQNSFQSPVSLKSSQSLAVPSRLPRAQPTGKDFNSGLNFSLLESLSTPNDDSVPRYFSLTSPLSNFSLVVRTPSGNPDFWASTSRATKSLESLETSEELLYISASDECPSSGTTDTAQLLLAVTVDYAKGVYSAWNATYLDSKPISKVLTGGSTPTIGSKNRRRSSFVATTGNATPAVRPRDNLRESLGAAAGEVIGKKKSSKKKDAKSLREEAEDTLASQIDPDFEPRRTARESRRVSSMISRADLNPSFDRSAFQDLASQHGAASNSFGQHGRRGHSLGNTSDRLSYGASQRRLRASTPGALSRLSIEEISELGGTPVGISGSQASTTFEDHEMLADMTSNDDDFDGFDLQAPLDGLRKEVLVRKFAEIPIQIGSAKRSTVATADNTLSQPKIKVFTLLSPVNCEERGPYSRRFFLYIFNHLSRECVQVEFSVRYKHSPNSSDDPEDKEHSMRRAVPMPSFRSVSRLNDIIDVMKLSDGGQSRMLFLSNGRSGQSSVRIFSPWSPEYSTKVPLHRLWVFNPYDMASRLNLDLRGVGAHRSFVTPKQLIRLTHKGPKGLFDIVSLDNQAHRLLLQLWPKNNMLSKIMDIFLFALPLSIGEKILIMWWNRHNSLHNVLQKEWHALVISLFSMFLACEGDKRKRRPKKNTDISQSDDRIAMMRKLETSWNDSSTQTISAWAWAKDGKSTISSFEGSPFHHRTGPLMSPGKSIKLNFLKGHVTAARDFIKSGEVQDVIDSIRNQRAIYLQAFPKVMVILHLIREEMKLASTSRESGSPEEFILVPAIAQLGRWLDWPDWDWKESKYYHYELSQAYDFEDGKL